MKACNLCKNFTGFGAHWLAGSCLHHSNMSMMEYCKNAENCSDFTTDFVSCCQECARKECNYKSDTMSGCSKMIKYGQS